jgi:hypothetical protein
MNTLKRGTSTQFPSHHREQANHVEVIHTALHFNAVQAQLESHLNDRNHQAARDLDHLQELKCFMNKLASYRQQIVDKVDYLHKEYRDKTTEAEDAESLKEIDEMMTEARLIILQFGYEGVSLDILTYCPELAHKDFTKQEQSNIGQQISETSQVGKA